jgi:hypothetical protein
LAVGYWLLASFNLKQTRDHHPMHVYKSLIRKYFVNTH